MPYKAFLPGHSQAQVFDLYKTSHAVHQQGSPRTRPWLRYRPSWQSRSRSPQAAPSGALAQLHDSSSAATYSCKCPKSSNPSPFPTEPPRNLKLTYIFWSRDRSADVVSPSGSPATSTQPAPTTAGSIYKLIYRAQGCSCSTGHTGEASSPLQSHGLSVQAPSMSVAMAPGSLSCGLPWAW